MALPVVNTTITDGALGIVAPTTANVHLKLGVCSSGVVNQIYSETQATQAMTDLGQGPLTEAVAHSLNVAGGQVYAIPVNPSVSGTTTAGTPVGAGSGTMTATGAAYDVYAGNATIVAGGALGAATFKWTLDGVNYSPVTTVPSGGVFVIPNSNVTLTFASTQTAGAVYPFTTTAPGFALADVQAAMAVALADPRTWGFVHIVGPAATLAGAASMAAGMDVLMTTAFNAYRYCFAVVECPAGTDAATLTAFAAVASLRVMVCAGTESLISSVSAKTLTRSVAFSVTARMAQVPISEDVGFVGRGSLPGVTAIQRDESSTPGLEGAGFTVLRTLIGRAGFFVTRGHMFSANTSDFFLAQNRRVMDVACTVTRAALLPFLNAKLRLAKATGFIYPADAAAIESSVNSALSGSILSTGDVTATSVSVNRATNILSTGQLAVTTRITPNGYSSDIEQNIGFFNPALQIQAAS